MTDQTNKDLPPLVGTLAALPESTRKVIEAYGAACARTAIANQNKCATLSASAPAALSTEGLRDRLEAVTSAIADQDDREAQAILRETLRLLDSAPAAGSVPSDEEIQAVAESMRMQPWGIGSRQADAIAYGRALLAQYGSPAWQPIETAPKDGTPIRLRATIGPMLAPDAKTVTGYFNRGWWMDGLTIPLSHVTHWMPLPPAPQEDK